MGVDGELWDTAQLATSSPERIKMLYEFDAIRSELEKSINAAVKDYSADPMTLAASYISMCRNGAGQQHF